MTHFVKLLRNFDSRVSLSLILLSTIIPCEPQSSENYCRGRLNGRYADSKDCYYYRQCVSGVTAIAKCPRGHVFDKISLKCETSVDIPCNATKTQKSMVGSKCSVEGEIKPSAVLCERFLVCRNGYNYPIDCPPGLIFSNKAYECILAPDPCATDPASKNKMRANFLMKRKKSPYIGICDGKIFQNISDPIHCNLYIQCTVNQTSKTPIVLISACETGLLYSNETNQCENPAVVLCGQRFRNRHIHGSDPKLKDILRFVAEKNRTNPIDEPIEISTTGKSESTRSPASSLGRGLSGLGGRGEGNPDSINGLDNPQRKNHRIVLHDSSESFQVKIIRNRHNYVVIDDQSVEEKSTAGREIAPDAVTTESEYEDDTTTIQSRSHKKILTTTEDDYQDDTTLTPTDIEPTGAPTFSHGIGVVGLDIDDGMNTNVSTDSTPRSRGPPMREEKTQGDYDYSTVLTVTLTVGVCVILLILLVFSAIMCQRNRGLENGLSVSANDSPGSGHGVDTTSLKSPYQDEFNWMLCPSSHGVNGGENYCTGHLSQPGGEGILMGQYPPNSYSQNLDDNLHANSCVPVGGSLMRDHNHRPRSSMMVMLSNQNMGCSDSIGRHRVQLYQIPPDSIQNSDQLPGSIRLYRNQSAGDTMDPPDSTNNTNQRPNTCATTTNRTLLRRNQVQSPSSSGSSAVSTPNTGGNPSPNAGNTTLVGVLKRHNSQLNSTVKKRVQIQEI